MSATGVPPLLNDYPVIDAFHLGSGQYVVLVWKSQDPHHPFVTARWSKQCGTEWVWGHYFATEEAARRDFRERSAS